MIKSLLEPDEKQPEEIKIEREEKAADDLEFDQKFESLFAEIESIPSGSENLSEISEPADDELIFSEKPAPIAPAKTFAEPFDFSALQFNPREKSFAETTDPESPAALTTEEVADKPPTDDEPLAGFPIEEADYELPFDETITAEKSNFVLPAEMPPTAGNVEPAAANDVTTSYEPPAEIKTEKPPVENYGTLFQPPAEPESFAETARKSGLAYAAAITLFGAVVFMLIVGWFADLLFGSSPWGIVGGILLGAAIGFFQFFRMTAQIFKDRN